MNTYRVGDFVALKQVSEEDKLLGRYVGEVGIFQAIYDYGISNTEDSAEIRFGNNDRYVVYLKDLKFVAPATVESIFCAHGMEKEKELLKDIMTYISDIHNNI